MTGHSDKCPLGTRHRLVTITNVDSPAWSVEYDGGTVMAAVE